MKNGGVEIQRPWHVAVLIPARNEEDLLPRCLRSVLAARSRLRCNITCDIIVAVDSSTDRTAAIARSMLRGEGAVLATEAGAVGQARAIAATMALERYMGPPELCWLANTDADCIVPETWLVDHLALAQSGVDAIAGTVDVDHFGEHGPEVRDRFRETYLIFADGSHPHVHGANFGVRADAYLRAGGWTHLCTAEDHDLWNRLDVQGCRRASIGHLKVITSGRRIGRAPAGFAGALAAHNEMAESEVAV